MGLFQQKGKFMLDINSTDALPFDVAERVRYFENHNPPENWVVFRSKFEDQLWIVQKLFEEDDLYSVAASPIIYNGNHIKTSP